MGRTRALLFPVVLTSSAALSDSVVLHGERIDNVYVVESSRAVYICNPVDGTAQSIAKTNPALGGITMTSDVEAREALRVEYQTQKAAREREHMETSASAPLANQPITVELDTSHAVNLFSAPSPATPELRLKGTPGSASRLGVPDFAAQNASRGGSGNNPGMGSGNSGGFTGNSGGTGSSRVAAGGGGRNAGGGGRGGGDQGIGGAGFRNISDLFTTIDDAEVGETPNPITNR